jgi:hypothetical protein
LVGKWNARVVAVMDEPFAMDGLTQVERDAISLDRSAKMEILKSVLVDP